MGVIDPLSSGSPHSPSPTSVSLTFALRAQLKRQRVCSLPALNVGGLRGVRVNLAGPKVLTAFY